MVYWRACSYRNFFVGAPLLSIFELITICYVPGYQAVYSVGLMSKGEVYIDSNFKCQVFEVQLSITKDYQFWDPTKLTQSDT